MFDASFDINLKSALRSIHSTPTGVVKRLRSDAAGPAVAAEAAALLRAERLRCMRGACIFVHNKLCMPGGHAIESKAERFRVLEALSQAADDAVAPGADILTILAVLNDAWPHMTCETGRDIVETFAYECRVLTRYLRQLDELANPKN